MKSVKIVFLISWLLCASIFAQSTFTVTPTITNERCSKGKITIVVTGAQLPYTYAWSNGGSTSTISNLDAGNYSVTITDVVAVDTTINFEVVKVECPITPGLVFLPNGDGISDTWSVGNITVFPDYELQVFNRWGQLVHKQNGPNYIPWDGKQIGLPLPDATYYYIIYYEKGKKEMESGSITIVR